MVGAFFQVDAQLKRMMNKRFKELGYNLAMKKDFLNKTLGYQPKLSDMTLGEMETVINALHKE